MLELEVRPPYVRFEMRGREDRKASLEKGHYVETEYPVVLVTQLGSRDTLEQDYQDWLRVMQKEVRDNRLPTKWLTSWEDMYKAWVKGEEIPADGTALKLFPIIRPGQLAICLSLGVRTVEDLAVLNSDGQAKLGLGSLDLVNRAKAWLEAASGTGKVVQKMANLELELKQMKAVNEELASKLEAQQVALKASQAPLTVKS